jgi:hypothetical protein
MAVDESGVAIAPRPWLSAALVDRRWRRHGMAVAASAALAVLCSGCVEPAPPVGLLQAGPGVTVLVDRCNDGRPIPLALLRKPDPPVARDTPWPAIWRGTLPVGRSTMTIPISLDTARDYSVEASANFNEYGDFRPARLSPTRVTVSSDDGNRVTSKQMSLSAWRSYAKSHCSDSFSLTRLALVLGIGAIAAIAVMAAVVAGAVLIFTKDIRPARTWR